jgi:hypothetical protein
MMKLLQRNMQDFDQQMMCEDGLDLDVLRQQSKLSPPLLFVKCKPNSFVQISQNESKKKLRLDLNQTCELYDEQHLFHIMGLTKTNEEELEQMFPREVIAYLKKHVIK